MLRVALALLTFTSISNAHAEAPAGVIKGTVIFEGEAPERAKLKRDTDPFCAKVDKLNEDVIVTHGKLKDALVRIKNGTMGDAAKPPATPALIDQKDCMYTPRVIGLVAGQKIAVRNSDGTFHNVHGTINGKMVWNKPAAPKDPDLSVDSSKTAGDVIDIVCDVHGWMHAYAVVQDHPYFSVTGDDGVFEIKGLAPGTYTLEVWHPVLGSKSMTVKIGVGKLAAINARFSFKSSELPGAK